MDRNWSVRQAPRQNLALLTRLQARSAPPAGDGQSARQPEEIRMDLVQRVKAEIAAGTYDTPERWEAALDRLAERLLG